MKPMRIGLVTDSPSDLPADLVQRYHIEVVPSILVMEDRQYLDGIEITRSEFYSRLPALRKSPTTAAPSTEDFASRYRELLKMGCEHILGIFTAEKLTVTALLAQKAAEEYGSKISVLESGSLSMGSGFQVLAAAEAAEQGYNLADCIQITRSVRNRLRVFAALDSVEYVRRSGRVSKTVATLGGLMKVKPVVELREGVVRPVDAPRTTRKATEKLRNLLQELGSLERLCIMHTNAEIRAQDFLAMLASEMGTDLPQDVRIVNATPVIGTHLGPNGLGFAAVKKLT